MGCVIVQLRSRLSFSSVALTTDSVILSIWQAASFFIVFSLISFCSRFKVVSLYCNYNFFALCRNLLLRFRNSKNFCWLWVHVLCFGIGPCPFKTLMKLQKIYFLAQFYRIYQIFVFKRNLWGSHCFTLSCGILYTGCMHAELFSKNLNNVVSTSVVTNFYNFWLNSPFKSKHIGKTDYRCKIKEKKQLSM